MTRAELGAAVDDFRLRPKEALRRASELGLRVVELSTTSPDLDLETLMSSGRRHLARYLDGLGLRLGALAADFRGLGLSSPATVDERVARTCRVLELAADMRTPVVTAAVSALTHPDTGEPSPTVVEALEQIGDRADALGLVFAMRPDCDDGRRLRDLLGRIGCPSIGIGLDPGALVMHGINPLSLIQEVPQHIVLMHARDATVGFSGQPGHETRLSEGAVDLIGLLGRLESVEYGGPYIIRRTDSQRPVEDIQAARDTLLRLLPPQQRPD
jgi:sugar phosphate isomerase/epimerase